MGDAFVCSDWMAMPDGTCECGHPTTRHVRVGDRIACDECNAVRLAAEVGNPVKKWQRSNFVPAPHFFALNHACRLVNDALDGFGCYLVGSACSRRDYRDVDVRFIMGDEAFDRMFRVDPKDADTGRGGWLNPLWSLMCTSFSVWLSQQTGLPIDFQIQRQTQANTMHDGPRHALGIFFDYPGERPSDVGEKVSAGAQE